MTTANQQDTKSSIQLEEGTYEIIKNRLNKQSEELQKRLELLNTERKKVFGSVESALIATDRINTANNCLPADMVALGDVLLLGYNVNIGLKTKTVLADVFSVYQYSEQKFVQKEMAIIEDKQFISDFGNLYEYYKETRFLKFALIGPHLFMVFQTGKTKEDIKAFKWAVQGERLVYQGNRSTHEFVFPDQHEFKWKKAAREQYVYGQHPHVSIEDIVFVEAVGGDLTIKVENNTESGHGIYQEEVEVADQTLDDAEIHYAIIGNLVVIRILPYREKEFRYFVYNSKVQEVKRINALEDSCVLLPDNQGLIFSNGYYLQNGRFKLFGNDIKQLLFERKIYAGNGEDFLYVFYNQVSGTYVLLLYNLIAQKVQTPLICNGYSLFPNGELCYFKNQAEPNKHHVVQVWKTPFMEDRFIEKPTNNSRLFTIGNKDIVKGMAECHDVALLVAKNEAYTNVYSELVKACTAIVDAYYWIGEKEAFDLKAPLLEIKQSAYSAIAEYEKVKSIRQATGEALRAAEEKVKELFSHIGRQKIENIDRYVAFLADLRAVRGEIIGLRDLRYIDMTAVENMDKEVEEKTSRLSNDCASFLMKETALQPYEVRVNDIKGAVVKIEKVSDADSLSDEITKVAGQLEMLIDIVGNLKIKDATQTTQIIDNISGIYSQFNLIKADLKKQRKGLRSVEAKAEFNAQLKLVDQGLINYLDMCTTPDKADEYLSKLMVQLEELEGKFSDFEEFMDDLTTKREQVYTAFEAKKLSLVEERNRKTTALQSSAERILKAVRSRVSKFTDVAEINGYFASDLMIEKIRDVIADLKVLEDNVKADDIESKLKSLREETVRQLRDKADLFEGGANIIRFGNHRFSVNVQPLELSLVNRDSKMFYHLSGTNFYEEVADEQFNAFKEVWHQVLVSESQQVYRGEYLAYTVFESLRNNGGFAGLVNAQHADFLALVQKEMTKRYNEGYAKGIHDKDAALLLEQLVRVSNNAGVLVFSSDARAMAEVFWTQACEEPLKTELSNNLKGAGMILKVFPDTNQFDYLIQLLESLLASFNAEHALFSNDQVSDAARFLFVQLSGDEQFVISKEAGSLIEAFDKHLRKNRVTAQYEQSIVPLKDKPFAAYRMIRDWLKAYCVANKLSERYLNEAAVTLLTDTKLTKRFIDCPVDGFIPGLNGSHEVLGENGYAFDYNELMAKMRMYNSTTRLRFEEYQQVKKQLVQTFGDDLRLNEFKPRVMSSFVRNQLIDTVYLPLIGNNLAKQIGAEGAGKRTDLMGMLLLISPPGYGKTTLMEYLASRLGIIFMKINGPAIGHQVTALDPAEAGNAAAREELEKLSLAFEMGDNVMIYLDDIQHCNPEFLQKFISLCDAQRKIEGVYKGRSKTYDFRGKKVCVVMAGNPYTESGEKFKIPDMLANRADIYNLGDIIGGSDEAFKLSYIENALTSNPVLNKLAGKSQKDVLTLLSIAQTGRKDGMEFEASHSPEEMNEYVSVLKKLVVVRDIILKVNMMYIESASQADEYRVEPAFKLQGSYRDMNKMAEKIVPIMNDEELQTVILSHYRNEAQTLTTGAEANLLKFKELYGVINEEEQARWEAIKDTFIRSNRLKGMGNNQTAQVLVQMEEIAKGLQGIKEELNKAAKSN